MDEVQSQGGGHVGQSMIPAQARWLAGYRPVDVVGSTIERLVAEAYNVFEFVVA